MQFSTVILITMSCAYVCLSVAIFDLCIRSDGGVLVGVRSLTGFRRAGIVSVVLAQSVSSRLILGDFGKLQYNELRYPLLFWDFG
ncbi:hypothetical protein GOBAR_AA16771 [Gossypium barbadense]|uniref:Uncharacterized protein n=1 Tax=Gossypium barbadense TaxID=3634 RepID=A0A2P5XKL7_GOSBA|nr:hypothetical protein GOBAR_AA16771 [Gossypium barbadense]